MREIVEVIRFCCRSKSGKMGPNGHQFGHAPMRRQGVPAEDDAGRESLISTHTHPELNSAMML